MSEMKTERIKGYKRPGRPSLADIVVRLDGQCYINNGAYKLFWRIPGSRGPQCYNGADLSYDPATYEVAMRPTIYTGDNAAITPQGRAYTMRLRDFLKNQCGVELTKGFKAKFYRRDGLIVFQIPKDSIA